VRLRAVDVAHHAMICVQEIGFEPDFETVVVTSAVVIAEAAPMAFVQVAIYVAEHVAASAADVLG
jgi:hypothetical protein